MEKTRAWNTLVGLAILNTLGPAVTVASRTPWAEVLEFSTFVAALYLVPSAAFLIQANRHSSQAWQWTVVAGMLLSMIPMFALYVLIIFSSRSMGATGGFVFIWAAIAQFVMAFIFTGAAELVWLVRRRRSDQDD